MKRTTLKAVNKLAATYGYELVKGTGYFYFYPLPGSTSPLLDDSMVMTCQLGGWTPEQWEAELIFKLESM